MYSGRVFNHLETDPTPKLYHYPIHAFVLYLFDSVPSSAH
jgi:hypothetical protein